MNLTGLFRPRPSAIVFGIAASLSLAILLATSGCATRAQVAPDLSENLRRLSEMRDTCSQYATWIARDYANTAEARECQRLYIAASAAANSYIETLQFDIASGAEMNAGRYTQAAARTENASSEFLKYAQMVTRPKEESGRGFPLLLPVVFGLVDLGLKISDASRAANKETRDLMVKALDARKWKSFSDLAR